MIRQETVCQYEEAQKTSSANEHQCILYRTIPHNPSTGPNAEKTYERRLRYTTATTQIRKVADPNLFVSAIVRLFRVAQITSRNQRDWAERARNILTLVTFPIYPKEVRPSGNQVAKIGIKRRNSHHSR